MGIFLFLIAIAICFAQDAWSVLRDTEIIPSEAVFDLTLAVVLFYFAGIILFIGLFALILIPKKTNSLNELAELKAASIVSPIPKQTTLNPSIDSNNLAGKKQERNVNNSNSRSNYI